MAYQRSDFMDAQGRHKTVSLFLEPLYQEDALYTFSDVDKLYKGKVYPSLKRLYLEEADVAEYGFVMKHLASWRQWERMCANASIREHIEQWRKELELKLTSQNMKRIEELAASGNYNAAKFLASKEYANGKGRPTKAEKAAALASSKLDIDENKEDAKRVLHLINKAS